MTESEMVEMFSGNIPIIPGSDAHLRPPDARFRGMNPPRNPKKSSGASGSRSRPAGGPVVPPLFPAADTQPSSARPPRTDATFPGGPSTTNTNTFTDTLPTPGNFLPPYRVHNLQGDGFIDISRFMHPPPRTRTPPSARRSPQPFNIFTALLTQPSIALHFASLLPVPTLLSLFSISRPFNDLVSAHLTHLILTITLRRAPESSRTFLFKAYRSLCIPDPAHRPHPVPARALAGEPRLVPSLRWLQFILYRDRVANDIIRLLALEGHRLPARASVALKKLWLTMDIATNAKRIGLMHNTRFWTADDLYLAAMFFVKLDMRFTDPVDGDGETALRELLLGQRSLTSVWKCLRGEELTSRLQVLQMWVRYSWQPSEGKRGMSVLGVPAGEVGRGELEGWGMAGDKAGKRERLLRVDQLVMMESVRRGMRLEKEVMEMMLWGYIDLKTGENVKVEEVEEVEEEESIWSGCSDEEVEDHEMEDSGVGGEGGEGAAQAVAAGLNGPPQVAVDMGLI